MTAVDLARNILDDTRDWGEQAVCVGKARILESPNETAARALCDGCPVTGDCARWVIRLTHRQDPGGFIAGMTEADRNAVRREIVKAKRRKKTAAAKLAAKPKPPAKAKQPAKVVGAAPAKPPAEVLPEGKRRCSKCKEVKDTTEFYVELRTKDGISGVCILCKRAANRASARKRRAEKRAAAERRRADAAYNAQTRRPRKKVAA